MTKGENAASAILTLHHKLDGRRASEMRFDWRIEIANVALSFCPAARGSSKPEGIC